MKTLEKLFNSNPGPTEGKLKYVRAFPLPKLQTTCVLDCLG